MPSRRRSARLRGGNPDINVTGRGSIRDSARNTTQSRRSRSGPSMYDLDYHRRRNRNDDTNDDSSETLPRSVRRRLSADVEDNADDDSVVLPANIRFNGNPDNAELKISDVLIGLKDGYKPSIPFHSLQITKDLQHRFIRNIYHQDGMFHCPVCHERFSDKLKKFIIRDNTSNGIENMCNHCKKCIGDQLKKGASLATAFPKMSSANDMNPWPRFDHLFLPKLNTVEEMLIARVHPFMRVYRLSSGTTGYRGGVANMQQDTQGFIQDIPCRPQDLPIFIVKKSRLRNGLQGYSEFRVSRYKLMRWLTFLIRHNDHYKDLDIGMVRARVETIPEDGSIVDQFRSFAESE